MKSVEQIAREEIDFIVTHIDMFKDVEMYYTVIHDFESLGYDLTEVKEKYKERMKRFKSLFTDPLNTQLNDKWFLKS